KNDRSVKDQRPDRGDQENEEGKRPRRSNSSSKRDKSSSPHRRVNISVKDEKESDSRAGSSSPSQKPRDGSKHSPRSDTGALPLQRAQIDSSNPRRSKVKRTRSMSPPASP